MKIEINHQGLFINGTPFEFPFKLEQLVAEIGVWSFHERVSYYWDELGLSCSVVEADWVNGLYLKFIPTSTYDPHPAESYRGEYCINGISHTEIPYFTLQQWGAIEIRNTDLQTKACISHSLIQAANW